MKPKHMNKKGFLRIMEVMIAITFLTIAILYIYTSKAPTQTSLDDYMYNFQKEILSQIGSDLEIRTMVLAHDTDGVLSRVNIPDDVNISIRICDLRDVAEPCNMNPRLRAELENSEIYEIFIDETIISSNITHYNPKKVRIFLWQNRA